MNSEKAASIPTAAAEQLQQQVKAMAVVVRGVPGGVHWGFHSREEPRMHIQTVGRKYAGCKAWLETRGKRAFEPTGPWPKDLRRAMESYLATPGGRDGIERHWIGLMIDKGWLTLSYAAPIATLHAYPGTEHAFTREIDLALDAPNARILATIHRGNMALDSDTACLVLLTERDPGRQVHVRLDRQVFVD